MTIAVGAWPPPSFAPGTRNGPELADAKDASSGGPKSRPKHFGRRVQGLGHEV